MAMLYANRVMLGKMTFGEVPNKLKEDLKEILEYYEVGHLAVE